MTFRDKTVDGHPDKVENQEAITLSEFTDRVYYNAPDTCVLNGMHGGKGEMSCNEFYVTKIIILALESVIIRYNIIFDSFDP